MRDVVVGGRLETVLGLYQFSVFFTGFCQHVEAGNDYFPASAHVAAVLSACQPDAVSHFLQFYRLS